MPESRNDRDRRGHLAHEIQVNQLPTPTRTFFTTLRRDLVDMFSIDRRSLAFVRILLGILLATTFLNFAWHAPLMMTDGGIVPRDLSLEKTRYREFSLFLGSGSLYFQYALLGSGTIAALLFAANILPRVSLLVGWILFYSATSRSALYNYGMCPAMLSVLFWSLFAPWNRAPTSPLMREHDLGAEEPRVAHWSLCGLFLSCAAISYGAGIAKFRHYDIWFTDFSALRLNLSYFRNVNPFTETLSRIPYFFEFASPFIVIVELATPLLLLAPLFRRILVPLTLVTATGVYVGIALSIHVGIFPLIPLTGFYLMIRGEVWEWCAARPLSSTLRNAVSMARARAFSALKGGRCALSWVLAVVGGFIVLCFAVLAIHDQTTEVVPKKLEQSVRRVVSPVLNFFQVPTKWAWIYEGGVRNKFLIVRAATEKGPVLVNITSVRYPGLLYNFFMNYSNSILRGKDDPDRIFLYSRFLCSQSPQAISVRGSPAKVQTIELFEVSDSKNDLRNLSANDQALLKDVISDHAPFFSFDCGRSSSRSQGALGHGAQAAHPGSAAQLPLLGWSQEFGVLRLNKSVNGGPISIRGQIFAAGFGTHANSTIRLSTTGMKRFKALVGIDDSRRSSQHASALVRIEGDGRELYRSPVFSATTRPLPIDIDISGVSELVLISEDAGAGVGKVKNYDDHVSWADPIVE